MAPLTTYQRLMQPLEEAAVEFLETARAAGSDAVTEKDIARVLNRFNGHPGGLARTVVQALKVKRPDLVWRHEVWSVKDGIVYFKPEQGGNNGQGA